MRMELPDRWSDITQPGTSYPWQPKTNPNGLLSPSSPPSGLTITNIPISSVWQGYWRKINSAPQLPSIANQGSECLYLIVMQAPQEDGDSREVIKPDSFLDTDGDGFPEIVDGWNRPIKFLRWPAGMQTSELQIVAKPHGDFRRLTFTGAR